MEDRSLSDAELRREMKQEHRMAMGQPEERMQKDGRDVIAFPVPECMCQQHGAPSLRYFF